MASAVSAEFALPAGLLEEVRPAPVAGEHPRAVTLAPRALQQAAPGDRATRAWATVQVAMLRWNLDAVATSAVMTDLAVRQSKGDVARVPVRAESLALEGHATEALDLAWRHHARIDPLTGALNRLGVAPEYERIASAPGAGYLLVIDLHHFKPIDDVHGHAVGDAVLKGVAKCIASRLRDSDALGRLGGEEFAVLFSGGDDARANVLLYRAKANGRVRIEADLSA